MPAGHGGSKLGCKKVSNSDDLGLGMGQAVPQKGKSLVVVSLGYPSVEESGERIID